MTLSSLIIAGFAVGLTGLIVIACCVALLLLTIRKETTRLDWYLVRAIMLGFETFLAGLLILIGGLIVW